MEKILARWLEAGRQRVQAREQHLELMLLRWDVFQADASLTLFVLQGLGCVLGRCAGICPAPPGTHSDLRAHLHSVSLGEGLEALCWGRGWREQDEIPHHHWASGQSWSHCSCHHPLSPGSPCRGPRAVPCLSGSC